MQELREINEFNQDTLEQLSRLKVKYMKNNTVYTEIENFQKMLYRYTMFIKEGMLEDAKKEIDKISGYFAEGVDPAVKFTKKAEPNLYKYVWQTEDGACKACAALNGTEYEYEAEVPQKPHPNCKCHVKKIELEEPDTVIIVDKEDEEEEEEKEKARKQIWEILLDIAQKLVHMWNEMKKAKQKTADTVVNQGEKVINWTINGINNIVIPKNYLDISYKLNKHKIKDIENSGNIVVSLNDLKDKFLKNTILRLCRKTNININTPVVIPKPSSEIVDRLQNSQEMKDFIRERQDTLRSGEDADKIYQVQFNDLAINNTLGHFTIYHPVLDKDGIFTAIILDYYDFDYMKPENPIAILNNIAYEAQKHRIIDNYVIIIPLIINTRIMWGMNND